ncbi:MAG TPA: STAS domain-containing protein [Steroidobacteraceae bacterium]
MSSPAASVAGGPGSFEVVTAAPGRFALRGLLTFANARGARSEGLHALRTSSASDLEMDCAGITHSDSAGLAVMLDWMAIMKREGRPLRFVNLPQGLLAVARISGVEEMLQKGV